MAFRMHLFFYLDDYQNIFLFSMVLQKNHSQFDSLLCTHCVSIFIQVILFTSLCIAIIFSTQIYGQDSDFMLHEFCTRTGNCSCLLMINISEVNTIQPMAEMTHKGRAMNDLLEHFFKRQFCTWVGEGLRISPCDAFKRTLHFLHFSEAPIWKISRTQQEEYSPLLGSGWLCSPHYPCMLRQDISF